MHRGIYHLSFVTATLLFSLICPVQPTTNNLGIKNALAQAQNGQSSPASSLQDRKAEANDEVEAAGKKLYDWLIKPLEPELKANKVQNLVFSLDRVTRYIPIGALFDGKQYLIENYSVSTVLSADLTDLRDRLPPGTQNTRVLALGLSNSDRNLLILTTGQRLF
jgi:CHAT domain-containing protein